MRRKVDQGWAVEQDNGDQVVLVRRSLGSTWIHFVIGLFTIWWTFGGANALYAAASYYRKAEREVYDVDDPVRESESSPEEITGGTVSTVLLLWLASIAMVTVGSSVTTTVLALLFAVTSLAILPPVKRRFRRRSIRKNGRTKSVDERVAISPGKACVVCFSPVEHGFERTYREEFCVGGIPLYTYDDGQNVYCRDCAYADEMPHRAIRDTPTGGSSNSTDSHELGEGDDVEQADPESI